MAFLTTRQLLERAPTRRTVRCQSTLMRKNVCSIRLARKTYSAESCHHMRIWREFRRLIIRAHYFWVRRDSPVNQRNPIDRSCRLSANASESFDSPFQPYERQRAVAATVYDQANSRKAARLRRSQQRPLFRCQPERCADRWSST